MSQLEDVTPPTEVYVPARARWMSPTRIAEIKQCERIMLERGAVYGTRIFPRDYNARWRAKKLIKDMVDLGMYDRWQLAEHVERRGGGWIWAVRYLGRNGAQ